MKWVKCSERMPPIETVVFREIKRKLVYSHILAWDDKTIFAEGRNDDIYLSKDNMEWLDESEELNQDFLWDEVFKELDEAIESCEIAYIPIRTEDSIKNKYTISRK